jgi:tetratricopeptide (TPR) repeat protein
MAITFRDVRQLDQADEYERRAIEFARAAGSQRLLAMARVGRAELSLLRGDARVAEAAARVALAEYGAIPDPAGEADALRLIGAACATLGAPVQALAALNDAVELAAEHGSALVEAEARRTRAEILEAAGKRPEARADAAAAIAIFDRLGAASEREMLERWTRSLGAEPE